MRLCTRRASNAISVTTPSANWSRVRYSSAGGIPAHLCIEVLFLSRSRDCNYYMYVYTRRTLLRRALYTPVERLLPRASRSFILNTLSLLRVFVCLPARARVGAVVEVTALRDARASVYMTWRVYFVVENYSIFLFLRTLCLLLPARSFYFALRAPPSFYTEIDIRIPRAPHPN